MYWAEFYAVCMSICLYPEELISNHRDHETHRSIPVYFTKFSIKDFHFFTKFSNFFPSSTIKEFLPFFLSVSDLQT